MTTMTGMSHPRHAHEPGITDLLGDPWTQGIITGVLTLIPVRKYPRWLRRSLILGPLAAAAIVGAYVGAKPQVVQRFARKFVDEGEVEDAETRDGAKHAVESKPKGGTRGAIRALVPSLAVGAAVSGSIAVAMWADEKIDRGLRRVGVPMPRLVMGIAAGALTWWSAAQEQQDQEQGRIGE